MIRMVFPVNYNKIHCKSFVKMCIKLIIGGKSFFYSLLFQVPKFYFSQYFAAIGLPCPTEHELVQHLLKALENSKSKSYHSEVNNQLRKRCWRFTKLGYCTKGNKCPFYHADKYAQASPSQVT